MRSRTLSATPSDIQNDGSTLDRIYRIFQNERLILDQAPFALRPAYRATENPKREGKEHDEKTEQRKQWFGHLWQSVAFDEDLSYAVETVSGRKDERDASELWTSVGV